MEDLQRALASKKGSTEQSVKEAVQQMATMAELQEVKESARLSVAKNAELQEENVELGACARTLEIIPLGPPPASRALAAVEAEAEGGMSLAEEMEDIGVEDENKHDGERLAGLVHFLQEDNVRLSKDKERLAEEFLRLSELVTARSKGGDQKDKMMEVSSIKKTGWLVKRNPQGPIKRKALPSRKARGPLLESASATVSGHINLENYAIRAKSVALASGPEHAELGGQRKRIGRLGLPCKQAGSDERRRD